MVASSDKPKQESAERQAVQTDFTAPHECSLYQVDQNQCKVTKERDHTPRLPAASGDHAICTEPKPSSPFQAAGRHASPNPCFLQLIFV